MTKAKLASIERPEPRPDDVRLGAMRALLEVVANGKEVTLEPELERQLRARCAAGASYVELAAVFCGPGGISTGELVGHLWRLALALR